MGGGTQGGQRGADLVEALVTVGDVVVEDAEGVVDDRTVAGPDGGDLVGVGEGVQAIE